MKKAIAKRKESHVTVMLIGNPDERVKRARINRTLLKPAAVLMLLLLSYSIALTTGYHYLDENHRTALARIEYLKDDNERQSTEISGFYNYSAEVRDEMENLIEFDGEVRDMVGLRGESEKRLEEFKGQLQEVLGRPLLASRGRRVPGLAELERNGLAEREISSTVMMSSVNDLNHSVEALAGQMDIQQEEMEKLLSDVDARLKYLEARPTFLPISGTITSRFGSRKHPFTRKSDFHGAVDIAARSGTSIRATGKGVITFSGRQGGYGNMVEINHGYGIKTRYAHNSTNLVKKGEKVSKGQVIARVGSTGVSTGPHVHFEIEVNGKLVDPIKFVNSRD